MESFVTVTKTSKEEIYNEILPQIEALVKGEPNLVANLANTASVIKMAFPAVSWVGFYLAEGRELVLGPFQGKPACVRIHFGKGVCGTSAERREAITVADVEEFPGHIVCDPDSRSEIVIPMLRNNELIGVLDVDSSRRNNFDETDRIHLTRIVELVLAPSNQWY